MSMKARSLIWLAVLIGLCLPQIAGATVHNISVANFTFSPNSTVANVGDTVRWTFVSGVHSATADGTSPKQWDSGIKSSGTFSITIDPIDGPGPFPFHCSVHETMTGTITVSAPSDSDSDGVPDISDNCPFVANTSQINNDGDGYGAACDCDDTQTGIHPGAIEIPDDGIDQDCSGTDAVTCFVDNDMDGFGSTTTVIATDGTCDMAQAESNLATDCNDGDLTIHPGAPEIPNDGIDQDCDGHDLITSCCVLRVGDPNGQGEYPDEVTLGDIMLLVDVKFISGDCSKLICVAEADVTQDGGANPTCEDNVTLGDIMVLVDFLFITGPDLAVLPLCN